MNQTIPLQGNGIRNRYRRFRDPGLVGVAQREIDQPSAGAYNFSWVFANDGDATYTYSTEII